MEGTAQSTTRKGEIQLLSSEVQDILTYKPHWFVRKGNYVFLGVILAMVLLACIISYPDTINASVRLQATNGPLLVSVKAEGKLERLMVKNGEWVVKGQPLAYIQNAADHEQVDQLRHWMEMVNADIDKPDLKTIAAKPFPALTQLGDLQAAFQDFQNEFVQVKEVYLNGYFSKKKASLEKDLSYISKMKDNLIQQQQLIVEDQEMQANELKVYEQLAKDKVIAPMELNQYKSRLLSREQSLKQSRSQITNSEMSSHGKQKELLELDKTIADQQQRFRSSFYILKNQLDEWLQQYVVSAPDEGRIEFVSFFQENQLLGRGQPLLHILKNQAGYYAEMKAGQAGIGKVRSGQKVIIRIAGYPSQEFGHLEGRIAFVSDIPGERDSFLIRVDLPRGLMTNYNKALQFRNNLSATAEVITDDRKLIHRIIGRLNDVL